MPQNRDHKNGRYTTNDDTIVIAELTNDTGDTARIGAELELTTPGELTVATDPLLEAERLLADALNKRWLGVERWAREVAATVLLVETIHPATRAEVGVRRAFNWPGMVDLDRLTDLLAR